MALYVLRRLVLLIVACFVTTIIVFLLLRLLPGDLALVVGGTEATRTVSRRSARSWAWTGRSSRSTSSGWAGR